MLVALDDHLRAAWHPEYLNALVVSAVMLVVLVRARPEGRGILRNAVIFAALTLFLLFSSALCSYFELKGTAQVLDETAILLGGLLVIRLTGITLFRVGMPLVGLHPPRILEDILIVLGYVGWGLVRLRYAGVELSGLVTTSAVITGIIAFSMQETLGNILGGLALQLDNSILIGDWIKVDDVSGQVVEVHWRHTAVRTRNGEIVVLPNGLLMKSKVTIVGSEQVTQWRRWVHFAVRQHVPPQQVINAVEKAITEANIPHVSKNPAPNCVLMDFKDGSAHYSVRYWLTNPLVDDPTDSAVRIHIYAALQRHQQPLAHPIMDVFLTTESAERDTRLQAQEFDRRRQLLRNVELFSLLSDAELTHVSTHLTVAMFAQGDVITRQGKMAHCLYILVSGDVDVWFEAETQDQERRYLLTMSAGKVFGEMGLMTGEPRSATVTARTDVECFRLDKAHFEQVLQSRPALAEGFAQILTERHQKRIPVKLNVPKENHDQQRDRILASIRRFFRLNMP